MDIYLDWAVLASTGVITLSTWLYILIQKNNSLRQAVKEIGKVGKDYHDELIETYKRLEKTNDKLVRVTENFEMLKELNKIRK